MYKRTDISKVMIIGSGPIVIGQACEFDYSGTQACKALRELGYTIVLVNSNPATIMTDPGMADATYIEPLSADSLERIIAKERPDALLPNLGGQSGLNLSSELYQAGVLDKYGVKVIAEADAIADGVDAFVPAVMEHIEQAGVHSGDSACVIPPVNIPEKHLQTIYEHTKKIAKELKVIGLMNMQYAIWKDRVYVLEANPRASRTVPIVSKVCGIPMAKIATRIMLGKKLGDLGLSITNMPYFGVKEAVFPFSMFPEVDPVIGPEMRSTGEVLGLDSSYGLAFYKAQKAAKSTLPTKGAVLITVCERDRDEKLAQAARHFAELGFKLLSTEGTHNFLQKHGIESEPILKMHQGRPNIVDAIKNKEIQLIVNTPAGKLSVTDDSYIRKSAIQHNVPYITTVAAAVAAAEGIDAKLNQQATRKSLQEYHAEIH